MQRSHTDFQRMKIRGHQGGRQCTVRTHQLGGAEIEQFDDAASRDEHVRRLQVEMHDQIAVCVAHRRADLEEQGETCANVEALRVTISIEMDTLDVLHDQVRPVIVNGIDDIAVRSDFSSRVLQADLPLLPDKSKAGEEGLWGEYYRERPMILGALLDMTAAAMRGFAAEPISPNGRFKDLQRWVAAAERGTDMPQGFMNAYKAGTDNAVIHAVEASAFASAILRLVEQRGKWSGTATELLNELDDKVDDRTRKSRGWPQTSRAVKNAVARAAPNLRVVGVECAHKKSGSRTIYLDRLGKLSPKTLISPKPGNGTDSKPGDTSSDMGDENKELGDGQEDMHGISPTCKSISYAALGDTDDLGDKKPPQANCIHSKQNNATDTDWVEGEM